MTELKTLQDIFTFLEANKNETALFSFREGNTETWSCAELTAAARKLAQGLRDQDVGPGDHVVVMRPTSPEWVVAALAILRVAGVVVPVDSQFADNVLGHVLQDAKPRVVLTTHSGAKQVERLLGPEAIDCILLDGDSEDPRHWRQFLKDEEPTTQSVNPDDRAVLFYTSGTTGKPKGVPLTHRNLVFQMNTVSRLELIRDTDRVLLPLPLHHVYPFVIGLFAPLVMGLPVIFPESLTGPQLIRAIREGEASVLVGVPRLYRALYDGLNSRIRSRGWWAWELFQAARWIAAKSQALGLPFKWMLAPVRNQIGPKLRLLASGGSALDPELGQNLETLGWQVAVGYGLTETSPLLTLRLSRDEPLDSVGKPLESVEVRLKALETEDDHQKGTEIQVRGPGVFQGYHNLPEKTEETFAEDGWYRTGDLGTFNDEGRLHVTGRVSTMIVTESGENIQPDSVEEAYQEAPEIREVGVLLHDKQLVAIVVPDIGELRKRDVDDVDSAVRTAIENRSKELPSYQQLSDYVVTREALARTRLGKVRRHLLGERYERLKNPDEHEERQTGPMPIAEMSDEDKALLEQGHARRVWEWFANRYPDQRLTPDTSPEMDLGIDSMEWLNVTMELRQQTGVDLDGEAIQDINTVRDLIQEVNSQAGETERASVEEVLERPEEFLDDDQLYWLSPLNSVQVGIARGAYSVTRTMMQVLFSVDVRGLENLPRQEPFVLAPNHASNLDAPAIAAVLDNDLLRQTYWAGWTGITFKNFIARTISRYAQVVPIKQEGAVASSLAFGAAVLRKKKNLVWFAEGVLSRTGELQPFKPGLGILLDHYPVRVVPTYVHGSFEALPKHRNIPRLRPLTVTFGVPVETETLRQEGEGDEPHGRIMDALHRRVQRLMEEFKKDSAQLVHGR